MSVTKEQVEEAIKYLDDISKGQASMELSPEVNGGGSENISELKSEMMDYIKKAKDLKEKIDEIEKGCMKKGEEVETKEEEEEEEEGRKKEKEIKEESLDKEEIMKGFEAKVLEIEGKKNEEIELLKSQLSDVLTKISEIEKTPIRKSISSEQELTYVEKFEKAKSEGKTVVSKLFQKGIVSNHIYNMYVESNDELEKSELGEVITEFESSGYLRPEVQKKLSEKYKIEIV